MTTTTDNKIMRVAGYCRVSTQEQAQHGVSLAEQQERLKAWAAMEHWQIVETYIDEGVSGGTDQRPRLQDLILDAKAGRFDLVCVTKIDRLMRNVRLLLNLIDALKQSNVAVVAQTEGIDTRDHKNGNIILNMMATMAEWERTRIGERVSNFRTHLSAKGQWSSGRTPYGYRFDKTTKQLVIENKEAEAIRYAFAEYTKPESIGIVKLAELLNKAGYMPPRMRSENQKSDFWTQTTARHILTHPAYKGGPNERWKFNTPMIINPDVWLLAQKRLSTNRHFRDNTDKSLYQGLFKCGLCGHVLRIGYNHSTEKVWECPGRLRRLHLDDSPRCTLPRFKTEKIEGIVVEKITNLYDDPEMLKKYVLDTIQDLEHENNELKRRVKPTKNNIDKLTKALNRADVMYKMGRLNDDEYKTEITGLRSKIQSLERQLDESDPLLLRQIADNEASIQYWQGFIENHHKMINSLFGKGANDEIDDLVDKAFTAQFGDASVKPIIVDPRIIDEPDLVATEQLRKLGWTCYVYPGKVELKGTVNPRQFNIAPDCKSNRCRQSLRRALPAG